MENNETGTVGLPARPYFLGCPVWACEQWRGSLYPERAPRDRWLSLYSSVFNTVEGNSTFYAMPSLDTVQRWASRVEAGFRFVLKFPRTISHEGRLTDHPRETDEWIERLRVLQDEHKLGPSFLQLPPDFDANRFGELEQYLSRLPGDLPFAVEVRHHAYFAGPGFERLNQLLGERGMDRVIFDSRGLFSRPPSDPTELKSQQRKPQVPVPVVCTGQYPLVRLIGRNQLDEVDEQVQAWAPQLQRWIQEGRTPFLFTHTPDDQFAPRMAERFHAHLQRVMPQMIDLPKFPGRLERKQRSLF